MNNTIAQKLAHFAATLTYEDIPDDVVERAKSAVLHALCVGLCSYNNECVNQIRNAVKAAPAPGGIQATMIGAGELAPIMDIAAVNAIMFQNRIQEDAHGITHIGPMVVPVALAMAEAFGKSGKEMLRVVVAAYEITAAISQHTTKESNARGFRATPIYGCIGTAATAAMLLDLNEEQTMAALTYACAFANGTVGRTTISDEYLFENGISARNGIMAALLARENVKADPSYFEIPKGFYECFTGTEQDAKSICGQLGKTWELKRVIFKLFPAGVINQVHILNAVEAAKEFDVDPNDIKSAVLKMNAAEASYPGQQYRGPFSSHGQTCISNPFLMATCLLKKRCSLEDMLQFEDPDVLMLSDRVEIDASDPGYPANCSRLTVRMNDGTELVKETNLTSEYFNCDYPTEIDLVKRMASEIPLTSEQLDALVDAVGNLDGLETVQPIVDATTIR